MPLNTTPLSTACHEIAKFLKARFNGDSMDVDILTGAPAEVASNRADKHRVNLFFHRFEASGLYPDTSPGDTWWMRAYCLVTPFAVTEDLVSAGENDLRLLGAVVRYFHETPVTDLVTVDGEAFRIHVIFHPTSLDDLNRLWTTQKDTVYRPSVVYELGLVPIVPAERTVVPPRVGAIAAESAGSMDRHREFHGGERGPTVTRRLVDAAEAGWVPALCLVWGAPRRCDEALSLPVSAPELSALRAWVAGAQGASLRLEWDVWEAGKGWSEQPPGTAFPVKHIAIDPVAIPPPSELEPLTVPAPGKAGQRLLVAVRTWTRPDGATVTLRSNPVLLSLYEVGP